MNMPQLPVGSAALMQRGRLSPATAWVLSLVVPGLGQLYARRWRAGLMTLLFVVLGWAGVVFSQPMLAEGGGAGMLFGVALRVVVGLWAFASVDAYLTASEINAGYNPDVGPNPRIAAVLNLLTRGFGYFYAGEKKRGWTAFILVGVLNSTLRKTPEGDAAVVLGWLSELLMAITALDGYRTAVIRRQLARASAPVAEKTTTAPSRLPPAVPVLAGAALVGSYLMVGVLDLVAPAYDSFQHAGEIVAPMEHHFLWKNGAYGVSTTVPLGWSVEDPTPDWALMHAQDDEEACDGSITLETNSLFITLPTAADASYKALRKSIPTLRLDGMVPTTLGGMTALAIHMTEPAHGELPVRRMVYIIAHRGLTRHVVFTNDWSDGACDDALKTFVEGYRLE